MNLNPVYFEQVYTPLLLIGSIYVMSFVILILELLYNIGLDKILHYYLTRQPNKVFAKYAPNIDN